LSVAEQRILLACISQVQRDEAMTDEIMYSVTAADIIELSEVSNKDIYNELKEAALRLLNRKVRIEIENNSRKKRKDTLVCGWVQTIMYVENEGKVNLRFNKDVLPYLTELKEQFTKYQLKNIAHMASAHAIRVYELIAQWKNVGQREVELEWFRKALMLEDKYSSINDLKKRVIDVAVAQINEHSDLNVSYTQRKTGRNVTHFIFTFSPKEESKPTQTRASTKKPITTITDLRKYIEQNTRPGETWGQAAQRLGVAAP
jgi:plasmid replication initiation protein